LAKTLDLAKLDLTHWLF